MRISLPFAARCIALTIPPLLGIATARAQAAPTAQEIARSETIMRGAIATIDRTAARLLREGGERYSSPHVIAYDRSIDTRCGRLGPFNAHACEDGNIYYDRAFIPYLVGHAAEATHTDGNLAAILTIAHEWGHALQYQLHLDFSTYSRAEQDADCLAAVLIVASRAGAPLTRSELAEAESTMTLLGDKPMLTGEWGRAMDSINAHSGRRGPISNSWGSHGDAVERVHAFRDGLTSTFRGCIGDIPRRGQGSASTPLVWPSPTPQPLSIHWYVDHTADAYDDAVKQHKPTVLVAGDFSSAEVVRFKNEVLFSAQLAQLAPYAVFVYADPTHDVAARNIGKALDFKGPLVISLLAPNANALDEAFRIIGIFDAVTVTTQLTKGLRKEGWMTGGTPPATTRAPWMPPRATPPT